MSMHSVNERGKLYAVAPADGQCIAVIDETPLDQVPVFYEKGRKAFREWSELSVTDRIKHLVRLKNIMVQHMDDLARTISLDTGKALTEAIVADILPTIDAIEHIRKHGKKILGRQKIRTPILLIGKRSFVEYMPRGVVLVISPWNYPLQLAMVPAVSALASGNAVILKPSEVTPLVGKKMEELFIKAGFPEGLVQFGHGGKEIGKALTEGKPDYIFFTGSVKTGRMIQETAARELIPTTLELGGKDPLIVFADAHLERAAKGAVWGAFTNCGQVCMSTERVYVERSIYDRFVKLVIEETKSLACGNEEDADVGAMTFPAQKEIVKKQIKEAIQKGAVLETGPSPDEWEEGMFLPLQIVTNASHELKIIQEETFGPVLPIIPFDTEEEAIRLANDTVYGLNASVWSKDLKRARRIASRLVTGAVVINDVLVSVANHGLPFGGTKNSGIGRYHGEGGLRIFCHEKAIVEDWKNGKSEVQWYPYRGKYQLFSNLFKSYYGEQRNWIVFVKSYLALLQKSK